MLLKEANFLGGFTESHKYAYRIHVLRLDLIACRAISKGLLLPHFLFGWPPVFLHRDTISAIGFL